ncbi:putative quinol monooxygenase [Vallitalea okinawensis]|uniref:putative quinol monooxygenase n=1 Tax=Vallitalea okinawensis TaxID=2078660 RepID=UPI001300721D|nr:putative quinol monooxygenase [Vallitalea okinawensis]
MVTVIAKSYLTEENRVQLLEMAKELVEITVKQSGCIRYDAYLDENDPNVMIMVEEWESKEALNNHTTSEYYHKIVTKSAKYITQMPEVHVCNKVL